jgi:ribonuclease-3
MDKERQASLSRIIHYTFNDPSFMIMALTHRSFSAQHNERLEFLGDSVLSFLIASELYKRFPRIDEGDLSRLRAQLVKESSLSAIATSMGLGDFIRLGEGELKSAGWRRPSILADTFESIIGAIYLDGGIEPTHQFVSRCFETQLNEIDPKLIQKHYCKNYYKVRRVICLFTTWFQLRVKRIAKPLPLNVISRNQILKRKVSVTAAA